MCTVLFKNSLQKMLKQTNEKIYIFNLKNIPFARLIKMFRKKYWNRGLSILKLCNVKQKKHFDWKKQKTFLLLFSKTSHIPYTI